MSIGTGSDLETEAEAGLPRREWGLPVGSVERSKEASCSGLGRPVPYCH